MPAQKQQRAQRTRQKILDSGAHLFTVEGYHATSSKKIARQAGIAVGSFYNHFSDKKELLLTLYREHVAQVHTMIFETLQQSGFALGGADGRQTVQMIISQSLKLHTLSPEFHRQISALRYTDAEIAAVVDEENERVVQMLAQVLSTGADALRVDDLEAASRVVISAVEEVVHQIKIFGAPQQVEERLLSALTDMVHRFLYDA